MLELVAEAFMGIGYLYSSNTSRYKIIKIFATKKYRLFSVEKPGRYHLNQDIKIDMRAPQRTGTWPLV